KWISTKRQKNQAKMNKTEAMEWKWTVQIKGQSPKMSKVRVNTEGIAVVAVQSRARN
ncbi:hypothetical protein Tco_1462457, partial [Tanacetum coccineum]